MLYHFEWFNSFYIMTTHHDKIQNLFRITGFEGHVIYGKSILILSCLHLGFPGGLFPSGIWTKPCANFFSPMHATCHAHQIFPDFINLITFGKKHKSLSSPLCNFLPSPVISSSVSPNIFLNLCSSHNVGHQTFTSIFIYR